mmetsp:Transcript_14622/g.35664  ORF Transcript_14622/g.35664 Transcript_14622/m.35664 type:complete len:190 (-) Transcript_14622:714-1283(-)
MPKKLGSKRARPRIGRSHRSKKLIEAKVSPPDFNRGHTLRSYQLEGMNWLCFNWHEGRNSILADEMGLGKTVQSVSLFHYLFTKQRIKGPFLVVAPLSTIAHWQREVEGWTSVRPVVYHGNQQSHNVVKKNEWNRFLVHLPSDFDPDTTTGSNPKIPREVVSGELAKGDEGPYRFDVPITTFETVIRDS